MSDDLLGARRAKLDELRADGIDPFPHAYPGVVPIASGSLFTKIARGFEEWREVGLLDGETPTMNGAQAAGCSPVASAFEAGEDIHARTALEMFGTVDRDTRGRAKTINFAILYGISRWGLGGRLGVSSDEAQAMIDRMVDRKQTHPATFGLHVPEASNQAG